LGLLWSKLKQASRDERMEKEDDIKLLKEKLALLSAKIEKAAADLEARKKQRADIPDEVPPNQESDHG
jgi:hypothetical protein